MAFLTIDEKEFHGKINFSASDRADEKYGTQDTDGLTAIYLGLLQGEIKSIRSFWDCALLHNDNKPSIKKIEKALEDRIEEDGTESLFKQAFSALDKSGFFSERAKMIADNMMKEAKVIDNETDEQKKERLDQEEMTAYMKKRYEKLTE